MKRTSQTSCSGGRASLVPRAMGTNPQRLPRRASRATMETRCRWRMTIGRNNKKGQRRAVRLDEIGPRMELRLIKITEGVPGKEGSVIYHEFVKKTKAQANAQKAAHAAKEKLRKERREEQEKNVQRKKMANDQKGDAGGEDDDDGEEVSEVDDGNDEGDDEGAWDEEEEISEGEDDGSDPEDESESEDEGPRRPLKKPK
ncbi:Suppressor of SWI4 1 [Grifola frondosa]|uniref:Suppressor of SWI4 1 n=1 Tax=Grifola frondosa TaxID=5627 RepID=A0A1C7MFU2_GRIFR|nr:Suppressor of SWI4 1 [Grifola frondosa]